MVLAFVLAFVAAAATGEAPARYRLRWSAPDGCPDAASVERSIDAALAREGGEATAAAIVQAEAHIEPIGDRYRLRVRIGDGERTLEGSSCDELAATAAFIVAIAVDPRVLGSTSGVPPVLVVPEVADTSPEADTSPDAREAGSQRDATSPGTEPAPTPASTTSRDERGTAATDDAPASKRTRPRNPFDLGGRVHAGFGLGPSPAPTAVLGVTLAAIARHARLELEGAWWVPRRVDSPRNASVGLRGQLWSIGVRGCGVPGRGRIDVPLCAVVQTGMVHARGTGELTDTRASQPWFGFGGGAMLVVRILPQLAATFGADVLWLPVRGGFRTEPSGDVDRVGAVAFTLLGGLQWRLARRSAG